MSSKTLIFGSIAIVIILAVGGGTWYYLHTKATAQAANSASQTTNIAQANRGGQIQGKVNSIDNNQMDITLQSNGSQKTYSLVDTAIVNKQTKTDKGQILIQGQAVLVTGKMSNSAVQADSITLTTLPNPTNRGNRPNFGNGNGPRGNRQGQSNTNPDQLNRFIGTISTIQDNQITLQTFNGQSTTIYLQDSTTYFKQESGSVSDIKAGVDVQFIASANSQINQITVINS